MLSLLVACGDVVEASFEARCFDALDNEGAPDGMSDCADPTCGTVATCVPADGPEAGVVVDLDDACPAGFDGGETVLNRGLRPGACEGCECEVAEPTCVAKLWTYQDNNECSGDVGLSGGALIGIDITETCSTQPIYYGLNLGGIRADIAARPSCTSSGTGAPGEARWAESVKFCRATQVGAGCAANQACVPRAPTPARQCALQTGATACEGFTTTEDDWYTGVSDERTCGACFCTAVGGDCNGTRVEIGSDYTCDDFGNFVADNTKLCFSGNSPYSAPARITGTPTPAVGCTSAATPTGAITPTRQSTLCCAP